MFGDVKHTNGKAMTQTGQTGKDAYAYELAQVRNAQRELDARMLNLSEIMQDEIAPDATCTRHFGKRDHAIDREGIRRLLLMTIGADECSMDTVSEIIRTLAGDVSPGASLVKGF